MKRTLRLLISVFLLVVLPLAAQSKVLLVAAGIGNYPAPVNKLNLPPKDARAMSDLIKKNGNSVTSLLVDENATKSAILQQIRDRFANASEDDIIIFFFSGHGYQGGFLAYDNKVSYGDIRKAMSGSRSKNKMIFADACYSGNMRQGKKKVKNENKDSNVMLFLSSRDDETSLERKDMEYGLFTTCLKDGLSGKADADRDRTITALEIFNYVSKNVKKLSQDAQHPVMWGNFADDMPVIIW